MTAITVTTYIVQTLLASGEWIDASDELPDLGDARTVVRIQPAANAHKFRVIERRVTTVEEVMP